VRVWSDKTEVAADRVGMEFTGPQFSLTPRLRVGQEDWSLTLGGGISGRPYHDEPIPLFCFVA
jgi:hypothetical protein